MKPITPLLVWLWTLILLNTIHAYPPAVQPTSSHQLPLAHSCLLKLDQIRQNTAKSPLRFSEEEISAFLTLRTDLLPSRVIRNIKIKIYSTEVHIQATGKLPLSYAPGNDFMNTIIRLLLSGDHTVTVILEVRTQNTRFRYDTKSISVDGIPVPSNCADALIRWGGERLKHPMPQGQWLPLPFGLSEVQFFDHYMVCHPGSPPQ